jgi:predicted glycoside hydrolase/deacetylase ChbG (UPF0249 family)
VSELSERLLIVNADDYGLTPAVAAGILRAQRDGIVTSTSVLALAPGFAAAAPALRDTEGIGVGAHLAAVGEDPPLLSAREVPTLVDKAGRLAPSWRALLPRMAARLVDPEDLRREFTAQVERLQEARLPLGHVDTHQHLHLWPAVGRVVLDVAAKADIPAVRIIRSTGRGPVGLTVRRLAAGLEREARARGVLFPATATGLDEAGTLDLPALLAAVDRLGAAGGASAELATHPGEADDPDRDRYRWGYVWDRELAALVDPEARRRVAAARFRLGTYADLAP